MKINRRRFKNKICYVDIETSLAILAGFNVSRDINMTYNQILYHTRVITIAYMFEGERKPTVLRCTKSGDDAEMLEKFSEAVKEAEVFVGQNFVRFDWKMLTGRCWIQGLKPLTKVEIFDTLTMSRGDMRLMSHKLDYKSKVIGSTGKTKMDFDNWKGCSRIGRVIEFYNEHQKLPNRNEMAAIDKGVEKEINIMMHYNAKDVKETQKVFWSLLPHCPKYSKKLGRLVSPEGLACLMCGGRKLAKNGTRPALTSSGGRRQRWVCLDRNCGHDWTDTRSLKTTDKLFK